VWQTQRSDVVLGQHSAVMIEYSPEKGQEGWQMRALCKLHFVMPRILP
jgi:hypothetical protein